MIHVRQSIIILNDADHLSAMLYLNKLMENDPPLKSKDGQRLNRLAIAIERYEKKRYPI